MKTIIENRILEIGIEKSVIDSKINLMVKKTELELNSSNEINQKKKELIDLGKFISCYDKEINIVDTLIEAPDFLIVYKNKTIGIELTDLVLNESEKRKEGLLRKLFNQVEIELRKVPGDLNGIYAIDFISDISFSPGNKKAVKEEIMDLICGGRATGDLTRIRKTFHNDIHIYHSEASGCLYIKQIH